jgi:hypothetical protein
MTRNYVQKKYLINKTSCKNIHQVALVDNIMVEDNRLEILVYRKNQHVYRTNEEYLILVNLATINKN